MQLTVGEVSKLCHVPESEVYLWVKREGLSAQRVNDTFSINASELLEWTSMTNRFISPSTLRVLNGDSVKKSGLYEALKIGGVLYDVHASDKKELFTAVVKTLPVPESFQREMLVDLLLAREALGSTVVQSGIAIPHPRRPVVLAGAAPVARLCYMETPFSFGDAEAPVEMLFLLICPTVRDHQQLLSRVANALRDDTFLNLVRSRPPKEVILDAIQAVEAGLVGSA